MVLPIYDLNVKQEGEQQLVFDPLRKKYLVLTPEEHVRQCLIQFLHQEKGVPLGLISAEMGLMYEQRRKRYDLLVFDRDGSPLILCECKAPYVGIDESVIRQASVYNSKIGARCMILTNGKLFLFFSKEVSEERMKWVEQMPGFEELV